MRLIDLRTHASPPRSRRPLRHGARPGGRGRIGRPRPASAQPRTASPSTNTRSPTTRAPRSNSSPMAASSPKSTCPIAGGGSAISCSASRRSANTRPRAPISAHLIGRYANRIAGGKFTLDGTEYTLATNNGAEQPARRQARASTRSSGRSTPLAGVPEGRRGRAHLYEQGRRGGLPRQPHGHGHLHPGPTRTSSRSNTRPRPTSRPSST